MAKKPVWVLPDGSTVGQKDLGKVKPTPKATKVSAGKKELLPAKSGTKGVKEPKPAYSGTKGTKVPMAAKPKATPTPKKTLPTMAQYKQSAASKTMSYKAYLDSFKARGYK